MEWKKQPKTWYTCLRCGHRHVAIRVNGLIRWVCVDGRYTRMAKKHGLPHKKPCLPMIHEVVAKYRGEHKRCDVDYDRLHREIVQDMQFIPIDHTNSFLTAMPRVEGHSPLLSGDII